MLNHCANSVCARRFRNLEAGKLFLVEVDVDEAGLGTRGPGANRLFRHLEHYWLCDSCALVLTLSFDRARGVVAVPLARPLGKARRVPVHRGEVAVTLARGIAGRTHAARGGDQ